MNWERFDRPRLPRMRCEHGISYADRCEQCIEWQAILDDQAADMDDDE